MRFILLGLLLLLPMQVNAQRTLNRESFMLKVRPVLNGILGDFYQMIILFPDFPKEIVPLIQELDSLTADKEALRLTCPKVVSKDCVLTVNSLRRKLSKIRTMSLNLIKEQKMSSALYLNTLSGKRMLHQFDASVEKVRGELENASFLLSAQISHRTQTFKLLKTLDELSTLISLALVEFIPFTYREDFRQFYFNFVHPVQVHISKNKNYEFLNRNVSSLNFAINLLNMNMTKRNKKTPDGMSPYLSVIHNRWNSLLRYYF